MVADAVSLLSSLSAGEESDEKRVVPECGCKRSASLRSFPTGSQITLAFPSIPSDRVPITPAQTRPFYRQTDVHPGFMVKRGRKEEERVGIIKLAALTGVCIVSGKREMKMPTLSQSAYTPAFNLHASTVGKAAGASCWRFGQTDWQNGCRLVQQGIPCHAKHQLNVTATHLISCDERRVMATCMSLLYDSFFLLSCVKRCTAFSVAGASCPCLHSVFRTPQRQTP